MGFKEKLADLIDEYNVNIWMVDMRSGSPMVEFSFYENEKLEYVKLSDRGVSSEIE